MCGIIGWREWYPEYIELLKRNSKRGGYSTGAIIDFINQRRVEKVKGTKHYIGYDNTIVHYRAPTVTNREWRDEENFPLIYKDWMLVGNGIVSESDYRDLKDEDIDNDLYYVLKLIRDKGFKELENLEAVFALTIITPETVFLIRNAYPLYYNDNAFSSVSFDGAQQLKEGVLYDWLHNENINEFKFYSPYIL
jgi:hypothetical protein